MELPLLELATRPMHKRAVALAASAYHDLMISAGRVVIMVVPLRLSGVTRCRRTGWTCRCA